jgi:hypothetical protein
MAILPNTSLGKVPFKLMWWRWYQNLRNAQRNHYKCLHLKNMFCLKLFSIAYLKISKGDLFTYDQLHHHKGGEENTIVRIIRITRINSK